LGLIDLIHASKRSKKTKCVNLIRVKDCCPFCVNNDLVREEADPMGLAVSSDGACFSFSALLFEPSHRMEGCHEKTRTD
jgi:hypothetical protein